MIHYDSLLQNATNINTKCNITAILLQNLSGLLQNASGFLFQNVTVLLQNKTVITKYDVYYKLRQYTYQLRRLPFPIFAQHQSHYKTA